MIPQQRCDSLHYRASHTSHSPLAACSHDDCEARKRAHLRRVATLSILDSVEQEQRKISGVLKVASRASTMAESYQQKPPVMRSQVMDRNNIPRGGGSCAIVAATVLSCGIGGFNAATGGSEPLCYIRCCRVDCDTKQSSFCACCGILTCCYCGCLWPAWAYCVHSCLGVDFYSAGFFK